MKILGIRTGWNQNDYRREHDSYGGIDYYRIIKPLEVIGQETIGKKLSEFKSYGEIIKDYDAVLIKPIDNEAGAGLIEACLRLGKKFIVDQDDNVFESRPNQDSYEALKEGSKGRAHVGAFISLADAMICSTQPLMDYYKDWLKKVHDREVPMYLLPNYNDVKDFNFTPNRAPKDKIVIGWPGSRSHYDDLKMVAPALLEILRKNPNVEIELCGGVEEDKVDLIFKRNSALLDRVFLTPGTPGYDTYPEFLATKNWDIGIAPLIDDVFNRGKSHIKWMEFSMYQIPCVASRVYPYFQDIDGKKTIQHGVTGFLVKNKFEWVKYLQKLIDDENLRRQIGQNAYEYIKNNWQWSDAKQKIENIWEDINKLPIKTLKDYGIQ